MICLKKRIQIYNKIKKNFFFFFFLGGGIFFFFFWGGGKGRVGWGARVSEFFLLFSIWILSKTKFTYSSPFTPPYKKKKKLENCVC